MNLLKSLGAMFNRKKKRRGQDAVAFAWRRLYFEELEPRNLPSLVAAFNFNEGSGNVLYDLSGHGNNGTIANATWSTSQFGDALSFNGNANSLVTVANSPSLELTSGMTLEAWVNPTSFSSLDNGWSSVISKENVSSGSTPTSYALDAATGNSTPPGVNALIHGTDQGPHAAAPLPLGQWTFLAATYDGANLQFYVNGDLEGSETISGGITSTASPLTIGGDWAGAMFNGLIDNVRIYNTPLSQTAIQTDMHTPVTSSSLTIIPATLASATANSPYSATLGAVGGSGAYVFSATAGQLPSWLTLNKNTGALSGTPTTAGTYTFTVTATDSISASLRGSHSYTLAVNAASALTANPAVLASATANTMYNVALSAAGGSGAYNYAVTAGQLPSWLTLNGSTGALSGIPTATGTSSFTITATDKHSSTLHGAQAYTLTVNAAGSLTVDPVVLANATANSAYNTALVATGGSGTYTFAVSAGSLPSWLTLNGSNGVLVGTPTTTGTFNFTITASDANNAGLYGSKAYTLTVNPASRLTVSPATLTSATANSPFIVALSATGGSGAYTFVVSAGRLPSGLTLNGSTGVLSGTPTTAGTSSFTIAAIDKNKISGGSKAYSFTVNPANSLILTPAVLANATFNSAFSTALSATGGSGAYTFAVTAGQLPSGLTLSGTTGVLSGTPTTTGTSNFTITATDKKNNSLHGSQAYTLTVALKLSPAALANATANSAYSEALSATGGSGTYSFAVSAGSLPSWLTLNSGVLSGTPTTTGTYTFTITASDNHDAGLSGSKVYTLTVRNGGHLTVNPTTLANATANSAYNASLSATGGSGAYSFVVTTGRLPAGLTLNASTGVISGIPTTAGTSNFTITATDKHVATVHGSQAYTLTVNAASSLTVSPAVLEDATFDSVYSTTLSVTGGSGAYTYAVTAGQLPSGFTLSGTTGVVSGMPTTAGTYPFTITATDNNITSLHGSQTYTLIVRLNLSPGVLGNATANSAYIAPLTVSGSSGTETFEVSGGSLPSWLTLNANTGVLSGTPTATGTSTFTITDPSSTGLSGSKTYTLTVHAASRLTLSPATLANATANSAYSASLSATGGSGAYSFIVTAGRLPSGLTLNASTGVLSGTPTTAGTSDFTVTASDKDIANLHGSQTYALTVNPASNLTVSPASLANGTFNSAYSAALSTTGGSGAYTFAVTVGQLPSGLKLSGSTGVISGVPTTTGTFSFTITATDKNNAMLHGSHPYTLTVGLKLNPAVLANATADSAYRSALSATGGSGTYTFTVSAGSLPSWLTLNESTGVLSGTPTTTGTSAFTITVSDAHHSGLSVSKAFTLSVRPASSLMVTSARLANAVANSPYSAPLSAFGGSGAYTFAVTAGRLPSWLTLNRSTGVLSGTPTATGVASFTITAVDSKTKALHGSQAYTLTVNAASSLTVSPAVLANATANSAYSAAISATGGSGAYTFAVSAGNLPSWLSLNTGTGVLSGMPTTIGTSTFAITVTDTNRAHMTGSEAYTLTVDAASSLTLNPATLAHATANSVYSEAVGATGGSGTYTFAVSTGSLPSGLSLNTGTGVLTGTPTTAGTSTFTITATDSSLIALTGNKTYALTVNPSSSLTISPGTLANGTTISPYSAALNATGGSGTYSFAVSSGTVPAGLTLNASTGVLSGMPTTQGTFNFTITATDTNSTTLHGSMAYNLTVTNTVPTATLVAPNIVNEGSALTVALTNPSDASATDTAAGFHYFFALNGASLANVTYANSSTSASQSYTFTDGLNSHFVTARILAIDGGYTDYTASIQVNSVAPTATLVAPTTVNEGSVFAVALTNPVDPSNPDTAAGFHYAFALDGASLAGATYANAGTRASQSYTFNDGLGSHSVTERIIAQDGDFTDYTASIQVNSVPPTATLVSPSAVNEGTTFSVALTNPSDPSNPDAAAGFHYAFALDGASLAGVTYANASTSASQNFTFNDGLSSHTITGRIIAQDGDFSNYIATVNLNYVAPMVTIGGPYAGTSTIAFTGSATDPSAPDTAAGFQYSWNFGDGTSSTLQSPSHTYADAGVYTVTLTVSDTEGGSTTASTTATVTQIINYNSPGFSLSGSSWGFDATNGVDYVAFPGNGSSIATWQSTVTPGTYVVWATWIAGGPRADNAPYTILDGSTPQATVDVNQSLTPLGIQDGGFTWQEVGIFNIQTGQFSVQLSNNADWDVCAQAIRLQPDNGAAVSPAVAITGLPSSGQITVETAVNLGSQVIAPGFQGNVQYVWTVTVPNDNDPTGQVYATGTGANFSFTPDNNVMYQISLTVTTPAGGIATATETLTADPVAPTVSLPSSFSGKEDWAVNFSASGSDVSPEDAVSFTYAWNFGDGTTGTGTDPTHAYTSQGTYDVTVTVTDMNGLTASASSTATIANLGPAGSYIVTSYLNIPDFGANPTIVSVQSGNWSNPATWSLDRVPGAGDIVDIEAGTTVTYDVNDTAPLNTVEVESGGTLTFSTTSNTQMNVVNLMVLQGGELDIGTKAAPIPSNITATIVWINQPLDTAIDPEQYGNGLIVLGTFNTYGAVKSPYVTLAQNAYAGDTILQLASPATGWQVGDKLELPDTRQLFSGDEGSGYTPEWEQMTIQSISAGGLTITLTAPLQFDHLGGYNAAGDLVYLPQVVSMTRNITIHSQSATGTRGYALFTDYANVNVNYTSFMGMGRSTDAQFINSGFSAQLFDNTTFDANGNVTHIGTDEANRNAITFLDLIGPSSPQADGYQFTFNGNVVTCPLTPMPFVWGINVVNSYYGLIQDNDVVNWAGSGITVDDLSSYNTFNGNFVMRINGTAQRGSGDEGFSGDGFWFGNSNNYVTNNIVTDLNPNGPYGYAYEFYASGDPGGFIGYVNIAAYQGADPSQPGQSQSVDINLLPLLEFANNEAYGVVSIGMSYWAINYDPNHPDLPLLTSGGDIDNFVVWNLFGIGIYGYQANNMTVDGFVCLGNASEMAAGFGATGMQFSDYYTGNMVIENADIEDQGTGILAPDYTGGVQTIENSYFANHFDIVVAGLWSVTFYVPPRDLVIDNDQFVAPQSGQSFTAIDMQWYQSFQLADGMPITQPDQVFVYNYDGVSGDNFQLFYSQQAANFVVPQTVVLNSDGTPDLLGGSPVAGFTNAQTWAQYDIAIAGAVAPSNATTMANIAGLVTPI